ncbi:MULTISPECIES: toll/interleukin-1 receptor domain-containing protein [Bacillus]|uniref:toll/interleukin-1 receptor domain-containing protein n=1 Tax=Bacillus TaxID=1386 RepID=UPI001478E46B|nr:toll/interleukin-1 receptor domain-containing protein [Bacillus thuringiensis]MCU5539861.1 toll/interleukin-1 receptor domain-containing protein [Bacillus cereus]NNG93869.1 toll/interleukin-1 receptor domain-containing protein [Bacillus thuringiensis]HDR6956469.1 toll/interleukin-1 receptor domain-containing protein [Bacillus cereus]HDR7695814.1 toll/interleukin-1 receptor domain-containing protein [Bacillus thuringiensis]
MKVFLSWSGNESKQLAEIFKEWLPNILQYINPYMSAKDIALGERWSNNIADNLENSRFGLIFVTPSNINAPWINFEAGALSKAMNSKVIPILYKSNVTLLNQGPLKQFQSAKELDRDNIFSLIESINDSTEFGSLDKDRLQKAFDMWWPDLEKRIGKIIEDNLNVDDGEEKGPSEQEMLNVIYSKLIEQEKVLNRTRNNSEELYRIPTGFFSDLEEVRILLETLHQLFTEEDIVSERISKDLEEGILNLEHVMNYLKRRNNSINYQNKKMG